MANETLPITGGCLCGAVRFEASEPPTWVSHCHCRMCQKAYGQPSGIFVGFKGPQKGALRFTKGMPKYYQSSAWLERGFCSNCGSPLGIRTPQGHSVMIGTLDHPEEWPPNVAHCGIGAKYHGTSSMMIFRAGEPRTILILSLRGKLPNAAKLKVRDV